MREIKFRVFETVQKVMLYDGFVLDAKGSVSFHWNKLPIHSANAILLQFTGLKDKNGKEIYEGDILTPTIYRGSTGSNRAGFKCEVIFNKGMFCFKKNGILIQSDKPLCNSLYFGDKVANDFIFIGNIYENAELLKTNP